MLWLLEYAFLNNAHHAMQTSAKSFTDKSRIIPIHTFLLVVCGDRSSIAWLINLVLYSW